MGAGAFPSQAVSSWQGNRETNSHSHTVDASYADTQTWTGFNRQVLDDPALVRQPWDGTSFKPARHTCETEASRCRDVTAYVKWVVTTGRTQRLQEVFILIFTLNSDHEICGNFFRPTTKEATLNSTSVVTKWCEDIFFSSCCLNSKKKNNIMKTMERKTPSLFAIMGLKSKTLLWQLRHSHFNDPNDVRDCKSLHKVAGYTHRGLASSGLTHFII